jgi:hypothetical protein
MSAGKRRSKREKRPERFAILTPDGPVIRYVAINGLVPLRDRRMLQFLSRTTRVPQSVYLREAIRDLLRKYRDAFDGSEFDDAEPL